MPKSRELANKKNDQKDRQSRGRAGSGVAEAKKGEQCVAKSMACVFAF